MGRRDPRRPPDYPILTDYVPTRFMAEGSHYDEELADFAVNFIELLPHTQGEWEGKRFWLLPWQERIIRDIFGTVLADGTRQFKTAYIEIPKKNRYGSRPWRHGRANPLKCWDALKPEKLQREDETGLSANAMKIFPDIRQKALS